MNIPIEILEAFDKKDFKCPMLEFPEFEANVICGGTPDAWQGYVEKWTKVGESESTRVFIDQEELTLESIYKLAGLKIPTQ